MLVEFVLDIKIGHIVFDGIQLYGKEQINPIHCKCMFRVNDFREQTVHNHIVFCFQELQIVQGEIGFVQTNVHVCGWLVCLFIFMLVS